MGVLAGSFISGLGGEFVLTARLLPTRDFDYTLPKEKGCFARYIFTHIFIEQGWVRAPCNSLDRIGAKHVWNS